jgi:LacI family transcriptional regulator
LKVPEDISLIGFDDISFAHLTQPPLTTVILSRTQLAVTAFAALRPSSERRGPHVDYSIPTHLVMRGSTRAL